MGGCRWTSIWRLATLSRLVFGRRFAGEDGVRHRPPQWQAAGCGCRQPQARICDRGRFFSCVGRVWVLGSSQYLLPLSSSVANSDVLPDCPKCCSSCVWSIRTSAVSESHRRPWKHDLVPCVHNGPKMRHRCRRSSGSPSTATSDR